MEIYYFLVLWVGNPEFSVTGAGSCWGWSGFLRNPGLYRDSITLNSTWYSVCLNKRPPFIRPTPPGPRLTLITPPQLMISALILSEDTVWVTGGVRATAQDFWGIHYDNPMVINIQRWVTEEFCGYLCYVFSTRPVVPLSCSVSKDWAPKIAPWVFLASIGFSLTQMMSGLRDGKRGKSK